MRTTIVVNFRLSNKLLEKLDNKLKRTQYATRTEFLEKTIAAFVEGRLHID